MKNKLFKIIAQILILIIIIVLIFYFSNYIHDFAVKFNILQKEEKQDEIVNENENIIENKELSSIKLILDELYPTDSSDKYIKSYSSSYEGIEGYINDQNVSILVRSEATSNFSGLISNSYFDGNNTIRANVSSKKQIKTLLVGYYLDVLSPEFMEDIPYIFLLMDDGTVEYIDIKILLRNGTLTNPASTVRTRGTLKELENIIRLEQCNLAHEEDGYSTSVAIDKDGNMYNLFDYIKWGK